jgi:hypothetical protein
MACMFELQNKTTHAMEGNKNSLCTIVGEKVTKGQIRRRIFQHLIQIFLMGLRRINFKQMSRLGFHHESTYHDWFSRDLELKSFNEELIKTHGSGDNFVIFDPSFLPKSGKKTPRIGRFWSGCAQSVKRGLEIGGFAVGDLGHQTAFHLTASLTPSPKVLKQKGRTLIDHYVQEVTKNQSSIAQFGNKLVVDGYFGVSTFVLPVVKLGFELISCLRSNAVVFYAPDTPKKPRRGRPCKKGARIDWNNLDNERMPIVFADSEKRVRSGLVFVKALKRSVLLVIVDFLDKNGQPIARKLLFSTNLEAKPLDVLKIYRGRFQIEFLFRDAKQFTGLAHCQSTNLTKIENHINLSLTAVSVAKIAHHLTQENHLDTPFSMSQITDYYRTNHLIEQFSLALGLNPTSTKNHPNIQKLLFHSLSHALAA